MTADEQTVAAIARHFDRRSGGWWTYWREALLVCFALVIAALALSVAMLEGRLAEDNVADAERDRTRTAELARLTDRVDELVALTAAQDAEIKRLTSLLLEAGIDPTMAVVVEPSSDTRPTPQANTDPQVVQAPPAAPVPAPGAPVPPAQAPPGPVPPPGPSPAPTPPSGPLAPLDELVCELADDAPTCGLLGGSPGRA